MVGLAIAIATADRARAGAGDGVIAYEQGDPDGRYSLGRAYEHGEGVPKDDARAAEWFRKAAEQGQATAQHRLGVLYKHGLGVPRDLAESMKLFRLAAAQGNGDGEAAVGSLYHDGLGVKRNTPRPQNGAGSRPIEATGKARPTWRPCISPVTAYPWIMCCPICGALLP